MRGDRGEIFGSFALSVQSSSSKGYTGTMEHVMNALVESIATQMWTLVRESEHRGMYRHNDWTWCIENMPRTADHLRGKARAALNLGG